MCRGSSDKRGRGVFQVRRASTLSGVSYRPSEKTAGRDVHSTEACSFPSMSSVVSRFSCLQRGVCCRVAAARQGERRRGGEEERDVYKRQGCPARVCRTKEEGGGRGRQVVVTGFRREGDGTEIFRSTDTPSLGETLVYCFWVLSTRCTRYLLCLQRTTTRREGFNLDGCTMRGVKSGTEEGMGWMG